MALRPLRRADATHAQTHRPQTVLLPAVSTRVCALRPSGAAHAAPLTPSSSGVWTYRLQMIELLRGLTLSTLFSKFIFSCLQCRRAFARSDHLATYAALIMTFSSRVGTRNFTQVGTCLQIFCHQISTLYVFN